MGFEFERSRQSMDQSHEVKDNTITSEKLAETEKKAENLDSFEDCSAKENINSSEKKVDSKSLEKAEEDYEDCKANLEEMEKKNPELSEEDYDEYDDCGKKTEGQYVAEVTYMKKADASDAQVEAELQDAYNDCKDPEDMKELKENINENEDVRAIDAKVIERPETVENVEMQEKAEEYEAAEEEAVEAEEQLEEQQEAAELYQEELEKDAKNSEIAENISENEVDNSDVNEKVDVDAIEQEEIQKDTVEKVSEEADMELTDEEADKIKDEVEKEVETSAENGEIDAETVQEVTDQKVEEKTKELDEVQEKASEEIEDQTEKTIEENGDVTEKEIKEEVEKEEQTEKSEKKSFDERLDEALNKDEVSRSELKELKTENTENLNKAMSEKAQLDKEISSRTDEIREKQRGTEEYKEAMSEYNALREQRDELSENIKKYEEDQKILEKKSQELREDQYAKGTEAMAASAVTLAGVKELQERYDETYYDKKPDKKELAEIREDGDSAIKELDTEKNVIKQAMEAKMEEMSEYVRGNRRERYDTEHDPRYQKIIAEYKEMKEHYDRLEYSSVKLDENNKSITEQLGDNYMSVDERKVVERTGISETEYQKIKSEQIDKAFDSVSATYYKATENGSSEEKKKALFTADYEVEANDVKSKLQAELKGIEAQMDKFDPKTMKMEDYPEWKKLNNEKTKREEQLADINTMLNEAKNFERSNAIEASKDRLYAVRENSKSEQKRNLEKDRECVRNNVAALRGLRNDLAVTNAELGDVKAQIGELVNTYEPEELWNNKQFRELNKKYDALSNEAEIYDKQIKQLGNYNQLLSEMNGRDKKGELKLNPKTYELAADEKSINDAIDALKDCSTIDTEKMKPAECIKILEIIDKAEREKIPALEEQIYRLNAELSLNESYIKNNPWDKSMERERTRIENEMAPKVAQLTELVERTTRLKTDMQVSGENHSVKCMINADGTYTFQQRWTNIKEVIKNNGFYDNKKQFYANAYDRVSNCKFDETGNVISKDFSFKYKLAGYYSDRKIGNEKINLHNVFEGGIFNISAKGGWDETKGINVDANTSMFEIKDTAKLHMLNKEIMQWDSKVSFGEAHADAELKKNELKASIKAHDGWAGESKLSIGKVQVLQASFENYKKGYDNKYGYAEVFGGKKKPDEIHLENVDKHTFSIGDKLTAFEYENDNGTIKQSIFMVPITESAYEDASLKDIYELLEKKDDQEKNIKDIFEKGILKEEVKNDEKIAFQSKQPADEGTELKEKLIDGKDETKDILENIIDTREVNYLSEKVQYLDKMYNDARNALAYDPERKEDWDVVRGRLADEYKSTADVLNSIVEEKQKKYNELQREFFNIYEEADSPEKSERLNELRAKGTELGKEIETAKSRAHHAGYLSADLAVGLDPNRKNTYHSVGGNNFTELHKSMIQQQGYAVENFKGTCGDCSVANTMIALGDRKTEAEVVQRARDLQACVDKTIPSRLPENIKEKIRAKNGGTSVADRTKILDSFGYECDNRTNQSLLDIAQQIENGKGAIINVDHSVLNKRLDVTTMNPVGTDHALTITGVEKDASGNVIGLWIHDTGVCSNMGNAFYCSARDYNVWKNNPRCTVQYISRKPERRVL